MSQLLHIAERELKKVQTKQEQQNRVEKISIFLDYGRTGKKDLRLLTIADVPRKIAQELFKNK